MKTRREARLRGARRGACRERQSVLADAVHALSRRLILAASESEAIRGFVRRHGMRFGARRFVAGETFEEAVPVLRSSTAAGCSRIRRCSARASGSPARRGRSWRSTSACSTASAARACGRTSRSSRPISASHSTRSWPARTSVASRRTPAGLDNFVRMDMEESRYVDPTLAVYRRLRESGRTTSASSCRRTSTAPSATSRSSSPLAPNVRVCKGAYLERPEVAHPEKRGRRRRVRQAARAGAAECGLRRHRDARRADDRARDRVHPARADPRRERSSSRCSSACGRSSSSRSSAAATRCSWPRPTGRTGTGTSCADWPSGPPTSASCCGTSCEDRRMAEAGPQGSTRLARATGRSR